VLALRRAPDARSLSTVFDRRWPGFAVMCARALAAVIALPLLACDTSEKSFRSLADAEAQGMVVRGWIPEGLPQSATQVRIRWNLDTNVVRGTVLVTQRDLPELGRKLTVASEQVLRSGTTPQGHRGGHLPFLLQGRWQIFGRRVGMCMW
jgi:hypothetical protein